MSIKLSMVCDRPDDCVMGIPQDAGFTDWCHHRVESEWGVVENGEADPRRGIKHLVLTVGRYIRRLIEQGPEPTRFGGIASATYDGKRFFMHLDHEGQRWTWQVLAAQFDDGKGPYDLLIGRWPD